MSLTFIDFFAGIGGFRRGMELAGHKCVGFCEFDKYAVASYTSMHLLTDEQRDYIQSVDAPVKKDGNLNLRKRQQEILKDEYRNGEWYANDIRRVDADTMPRADCWCFGFPCQDISVAGKQQGFKGNRSSLFFAVTGLLRSIEEESRPKYLFIENVKNLLSVNRGFDFARLLTELDEIGYDAEWEVLNSKDFGVPQNRERVFIIGHLRGTSTSEVFPITRATGENTVKRTINDVVDNDASFLTTPVILNGKRIKRCTDISSSLQASDYKGIRNKDTTGVLMEDRPHIVGNVNPSRNGMNGAVYSGYGISPTLTTNKGEGNKIAIPVLTPDRENKRQNGRRFKEDGEPMFTLTGQDRHGVIVREATKKGYAEATVGDSVNLEQPNSKTRRGRVGKGVAQTLNTSCEQAVVELVNNNLSNQVRIRKLTPKECFRLQGWTDKYFERAALVNSDSQLYKQAGNGVTVTVIQDIAEKLE